MRTSTAWPWPTSGTISSKCPGCGRSSAGHSKGSSIGTASRRSAQGQGSVSSTAAARPSAWAQTGAAAGLQAAPGQASSGSSIRRSRSIAQTAGSHSGSSSRPSSASGVTTSVISGIATRLAGSPTSEICWKNSKVHGARPSVATHWLRSKALSDSRSHAAPGCCAGLVRIRAPGGSEAISSATATKDSQKPGCSKAQGSASATTAATSASRRGIGQSRAPSRSSATVASISTVRCAGTPQPDSSA